MDSLRKQDIVTLSRKRAAAGNKSLARQLTEMAWLYATSGYGPAFYHEARFWRRSLSMREMRRYQIGKKYNDFVAKINDERYYKVSQNKCIEKAILTLANIPSPRFYAYLEKDSGYDHAGNRFNSLDDLSDLFESSSGQKFCLKATEGFGGASFSAFKVCQSEPDVVVQPLNGDTKIALSDYLKRATDNAASSSFIIEQYLEQHSDMSALNTTSVNTIRVWVRQEGKIDAVVAAIARIGRSGSLTDNTTGGGLVAPIDLESGVLGDAYFMNGRHEYIANHPDHGAQIRDIVIPLWQQAKLLSVNAVRAFPGIAFAGLDIAISPEGPVVIELNVQPEHYMRRSLIGQH